MEDKLYEAAIVGDVYSLKEIIKRDKLILGRIVARCCKDSPLHVAASHGHSPFVKQLLLLNEELAELPDSQKRCALHLASAAGHVDVVKELIGLCPETCLARDQDGCNPVHIAAINGKIDVLRVLFEEKPHAAKNRVDGGDTILHLCVKYDQMETLKVLLKLINVSEFVNTKDGSGNTVLHLAVSDKHFQMVRYMLDRKNRVKIDVNAINAMEQTPLDILILAQQGKEGKDSDIKKMESELRKAGAKKGKDLAQSKWLSNKRDVMMVVASLIATMAFQAGVNPPGGVWPDNTSGHRAGEAVMAYNSPETYPVFLRVNSVGFVSSLSTILLLISGLPCRKRAYMWGLVVIMWLAVSAMAYTYVFSISVVAPVKHRHKLKAVIFAVIIGWSVLMYTLFIAHTSNLIASMMEKKCNKIKAIKSFLQSCTARLCIKQSGRPS